MSGSGFILGSSSPRRRELLEEAGFVFELASPDIDESPFPGEDPETHVVRVAEEKASSLSDRDPNATVLAADTIVVVDGAILGKPRSPGHAQEVLRSLSGRSHLVMTAFSVCVGGRRHNRLCTSEVEFRPLSDAEIARYVASGEPMDKAGAYGIQGKAAGFVRAIRGSYTNIVGLPMAEVIDVLRELGLSPQA